MVQDSHYVVLPFVRVGTCPTRNFAHEIFVNCISLCRSDYIFPDGPAKRDNIWVARIVVEDTFKEEKEITTNRPFSSVGSHETKDTK